MSTSSTTAGQASPSEVPIAYTAPLATAPIDNDSLAKLTAPFAGQTVGQMYEGPGWVTETGVACVVLIARDEKVPRRVREDGGGGLIAWRWNNTPSTVVSLTLATRGKNTKPYVRWLRSSSDPVVAAIRRDGRFLVTVANSRGQHSGWFEASFLRGDDGRGPSHAALESQWLFATPGIPNSSIHERFDFARREPYNDSNEDEIPLWAEALSDYWSTLTYKGPWYVDLQPRDHAIAVWGRQAHVWRGRAAGFVQTLSDRQSVDGERPLVDEAGLWVRDDEFRDRAVVIVQKAPTLGSWLAAMVGPKPDAKSAYDAAFQTLHTPYDFFCLLDKLFEILRELEDWVLTEAVKSNLEAVLLDARVTHVGTQRPWIANRDGGHGLEIRSSPFDLEAPLDDVRRTWVSGLHLAGLFDMGVRVGPGDFLAPLDVVCDAFKRLWLEGSVEEAEAKIQSLLSEAQEARQWSIPWGARVQVQFGPFTSVKIFEMDGEFSCHFLDDQDRYFLVAIGLQQRPPQVTTGHLIRDKDDDGDGFWNDDAEASLKLIAAAIVRDFIVVEDRESLFTARPMRRRIRGRDVRTVIYLPRVRYTTPNPERMALDDAATHRSRHQVVPHLRRVGQASAAQRFLAQRYGMHVPEGFTFVRPHERGSTTEEVRVRVYRSRSASRMIFEEVSTAPEGARPAWFEFEKDCARLLSTRGMRVVHQAAHRDGDGGVDLFAVDADGQSWVVQCKCWSFHRTVGPDVVRELEGAIRLADKGAGSPSRGMLVTTSTFTSGAVSAASTLGFELIDGRRFENLLK